MLWAQVCLSCRWARRALTQFVAVKNGTSPAYSQNPFLRPEIPKGSSWKPNNGFTSQRQGSESLPARASCWGQQLGQARAALVAAAHGQHCVTAYYFASLANKNLFTRGFKMGLRKENKRASW